MSDPVHSPAHYTSHSSGIQCIEITEHMNFCIGNAFKYVWRAGLKEGQPVGQEYQKALWYVKREQAMLANSRNALTTTKPKVGRAESREGFTDMRVRLVHDTLWEEQFATGGDTDKQALLALAVGEIEELIADAETD